MQIEVKFKKIHADAQLPTRKHGNRELVSYEIDWLTKENERFEQVRPEQYAAGYRIGYPQEVSENGEVTTNIIGTGDTGYDIFAVEDKVIPARGSAVVDTGIEVAYISPGFWFKIEARSGLGFKYSVAPHPGIVDNCVPAGTLIKTVDGDIPVDKLYAKENLPFIFSFNEELCETEVDNIKEMWVVENQEMMKIESEDGDTLTIPKTKLVLTKSGWKQAQDLNENDYILTF